MKICLLFFVVIFSINVKSQIVEGDVSIYKKGIYNMKEEEGWSRVRANGGLKFDKKGYIKFTENDIILYIGFDGEENEIYKSFKFQDYNSKKITVFGGSMIQSHDLFFLEDTKGNAVELQYFKGESFKDGNDLFIFSIFKNGVMFFIRPNSNQEEVVNHLYN